jgi:Tfp pilus assembly protein PilO
MMNLGDKQQSVPTALFALSAVVLTGALIYIFTVPVKTTQGLGASEKKSERDAMKTIETATNDQTEKQKIVDSMTYAGSQQDIQAAALSQVAKLTAAHKIKLIGFRPQRPIDAGNLTELPIQINVDGPFTNVVEFSHDLSASGTKLVVNLVQMAASDPSSDNVTANINIAGFLNQPLGNGVKNG